MNHRTPDTPAEIDDTEDRMGSLEPLDFSDKKDERQGHAGDTRPVEDLDNEFPPERVREAGMTAGEVPDGEPTMDDMSPETLTPDDGARSDSERGHGQPADQDLSIVDDRTIGAGGGLDEAEEALTRPLDGKPWDGAAETDNEPDLDEDDTVLSDEELEGDAPLDSGRDKRPGE